MKLLKFIILLFLSFSGLDSLAQKKELITNYVNQYKDLAVAEMIRTGVPAAITLAQGIHESGAGNGKLVLESNNHFGIKCKSNWTGESVKHTDDAIGECFRKYRLAEDSYKDHSDFLKNGQRYSFLFSLSPTDYEGWANGLKKAGYATNPNYPQVLIKLIEDYNLQEYTFFAMGNKKDKEAESLPTPSPEQSKVLTAQPVNTPDKTLVIEKAEKERRIYPGGEFKLNETRVVFVKSETSFLLLAKQFNIDLSKIFEFNDISAAEVTDKDQLVYLQRKRKTGLHDVHIVLTGETLQDIAREEAIRLESLKELNWLKEDDKPAIGESLHLKIKSTYLPKLMLKENYSLVPVRKKQETN